MHFYFLIEDKSTEALVNEIMTKLLDGRTDVLYECKAFHGIGGFEKKANAKEIKSGKLLNDLPTYLRGFNKALQYSPDSTIVVVLDSDTNDPSIFRATLENMAKQQGISVDHVFCLATEEMEAWLLGDSAAVRKAYPHANNSVLTSYVQDSICGTWETLANVIYKGGVKKLKKDFRSYSDIGGKKIEWAREIGKNMVLHGNKSPSFNVFIDEITKRLPDIA